MRRDMSRRMENSKKIFPDATEILIRILKNADRTLPNFNLSINFVMKSKIITNRLQMCI